MVERLAARGARLSGLEPRVRRIIDGIRRGGSDRFENMQSGGMGCARNNLCECLTRKWRRRGE